MAQLERIDRRVAPQQIYLVTDGMTGQDAVNAAAETFGDAAQRVKMLDEFSRMLRDILM